MPALHVKSSPALDPLFAACNTPRQTRILRATLIGRHDCTQQTTSSCRCRTENGQFRANSPGTSPKQPLLPCSFTRMGLPNLQRRPNPAGACPVSLVPASRHRTRSRLAQVGSGRPSCIVASSMVPDEASYRPLVPHSLGSFQSGAPGRTPPSLMVSAQGTAYGVVGDRPAWMNASLAGQTA